MQTFLLSLPEAVGWKWECDSALIFTDEHDFTWWCLLLVLSVVVSIHSGISSESARTFSPFCFDALRTGGKFCCVVGLCLCAREHNLDMFSVWLCYARREGTLWLDRGTCLFLFSFLKEVMAFVCFCQELYERKWMWQVPKRMDEMAHFFLLLCNTRREKIFMLHQMTHWIMKCCLIGFHVIVFGTHYLKLYDRMESSHYGV